MCVSVEKYIGAYTIIMIAIVFCVYCSNYKIQTISRGIILYSGRNYVNKSNSIFNSVCVCLRRVTLNYIYSRIALLIGLIFDTKIVQFRTSGLTLILSRN